MSQTPLLGTASIPAVPLNASEIGLTDPGGIFGGAGDVQAALEAFVLGLIGGYLTKVGGEIHTIDTSHPTLGATATFDIGNGNVQPGTLTEDCTISIAGWTTGSRCYTVLSLTGDGTSTPTVSGVTWIGSPPGVIGSGEVLHLTLFSDDGGTIIWGAVVGGAAAASDAMVPYLIEAGETFTVPVKKQALFNYPITVDAGGSLVVSGYLVMVT